MGYLPCSGRAVLGSLPEQGPRDPPIFSPPFSSFAPPSRRAGRSHRCTCRCVNRRVVLSKSSDERPGSQLVNSAQLAENATSTRISVIMSFPPVVGSALWLMFRIYTVRPPRLTRKEDSGLSSETRSRGRDGGRQLSGRFSSSLRSRLMALRLTCIGLVS